MAEINRQWLIANRPVGKPKLSDFRHHETSLVSPSDGEVLLKTMYLGLAPVMRMYMLGQSAAGEKPLDIGDVIHGRGVARVMESRHPEYQVGDVVQGQMGWQTWKTSAMTTAEKFSKFEYPDLSPALGVSILSMTGLSAYAGFVECGSPRKGDVVLVSGAAGGVGSIVVQIARIMGCRVVAIAGGPDKCAFLERLGVDATIDYKNQSVEARIADTCPDGIDVFFDNVGGETLQIALQNLAQGSRIVPCGSISEYTRDEPFGLVNVGRHLRTANASMHGFFVYNMLHMFKQSNDALAEWIRQGKFTPVLDIIDGFEQMPEALSRLYEGRNVGVQCCRVDDPE